MLKQSSNLFLCLLIGDVALILLNVFPVGTELIDRSLNLDREANFATWYASAKLLVLTMLSWVVSICWQTRKKLSRATALVFLAASISETAMFHERSFGAAYTIAHGAPPTTGLPGGWVFYFAPLVGAGFAVLLWFVVQASRQFPDVRGYLGAGLSMWLVAVGSEAAPYLLDLDSYSTPHALALIEESAELLGTTAFVGGLGWIAKQHWPSNTPLT